MEQYDYLIETLEKSVQKNGEIPLTNKHLLNILKQVDRKIDKIAEQDQYQFDPNWD